MDDNLLKAILAIAGAIAGGLIASAANAYAARQKTKEVELSYEYKLRDGYLENARKMAGEVYLPINIALTSLANAYDQFRRYIDFDKAEVPTGATNAFLGESRKYLSELDDLFARGADAYLTSALDDKLRRFNAFVRDSLHEKSVNTKLVLEAETSLPFMSGTAGRIEHRIHSNRAARIPSISLRLPVALGLNISYVTEVLSAPVYSRAFEKRFQIDLAEIKSLIKEVILGSQSERR